MREIKFRAWHGKLNKMVYGIQVRNSLAEWKDENGKWWIFEDDIMQFIGLKDRNGSEIFDGDIIKSKPKDSNWGYLICKIVFNELTTRFEAQQYWPSKDTFLSLSNNHDYYEYEVIGNIYENTELLNQ